MTTHIESGEAVYLRRLAQERDLANVALDKFVQHLSQRYQLTAADQIDLDGTITRAEQPITDDEKP